VAGGLEHVSRTAGKGSARRREPRFVDESRSDFVNHMYIPMGLTAENVAREVRHQPREDGRVAKAQPDRAVEAQKNGVFEREINPGACPTARCSGGRVTPGHTTLEGLANLKTVFKENGRVTAGNPARQRRRRPPCW